MRARRVNASRATRSRRVPRANAYSLPQRCSVAFQSGALIARKPPGGGSAKLASDLGEGGSLVLPRLSVPLDESYQLVARRGKRFARRLAR